MRRIIGGDERGMALPVLLVVMAILLVAGAVLLSFAGSAVKAARREVESEQAFYAAEAGLHAVIARVTEELGLNWVQGPGALNLSSTDICPDCPAFSAQVTWDCTAPCVILLVSSEGRAGSTEYPAVYRLTAEISYSALTNRPVVIYR